MNLSHTSFITPQPLRSRSTPLGGELGQGKNNIFCLSKHNKTTILRVYKKEVLWKPLLTQNKYPICLSDVFVFYMINDHPYVADTYYCPAHTQISSPHLHYLTKAAKAWLSCLYLHHNSIQPPPTYLWSLFLTMIAGFGWTELGTAEFLPDRFTFPICPRFVGLCSCLHLYISNMN